MYPVGLLEDTDLCAILAKSHRHAQRHPVGSLDAGSGVGGEL